MKLKGGDGHVGEVGGREQSDGSEEEQESNTEKPG